MRLGSLQMAEFAYGPTGHNAHFGPVHNPFALAHVTGGSSSGSGSAVAARLTFAALGSDTGGSIRMPAHFCGVTGLKTTVGRVSRAGAMPLSQSLDTVGPLARTAEDCALLLGLMAGADPADPTALPVPLPDYAAATAQSMKGLSIGVPGAFYVDDLDAEVAGVLDATIAVFKREGANIVQVDLPDQRQLSSASQLVLAVEAAAFHKRWMIERPQDYGPQVLMRLQNGLAISGVTYLEALRWRGPALAAHNAATANVDAVIAPVSPITAPTIAESDVGDAPNAEAVIQRLTRFTRPINYLGLPSLSIPSGFTSERPSRRTATGRPLVRRGDDLADRCGLPARDGLSRKGAAAAMTTLVDVSNLNIRFSGERTVHAVNNLSFSVGEGEVLGLLGESGSGKSVTLRALMRLLPRKRTKITGQIRVRWP